MAVNKNQDYLTNVYLFQDDAINIIKNTKVSYVQFLFRKCPVFVQLLFGKCSGFVQKNTNRFAQLIENQQTKITPASEKKKYRIIVQESPPPHKPPTVNCKL